MTGGPPFTSRLNTVSPEASLETYRYRFPSGDQPKHTIARVLVGFLKLPRLLPIRPHEPDFALAELSLVCPKRNQRAIRRNRPSEGMVAKLCGCSAEHRNRPDAAVDRTPVHSILCVGMNINQEPGAVGKPGSNFPFHALILERLRLRNGTSFAGVNELDVQPTRVDIGQVFAVRGNRATGRPGSRWSWL